MGKALSPNTTMPHAIVIALNSMQGLQTARILADRGVRVIGVASDPNHYACKTRACEKIVYCDTGTEELIDVLKALATDLPHGAVLFPCQDKCVLVISKCRDELEPFYRVVLPQHDVVEMMMDKVKFYTFASANGFPIPKTRFLYSRRDAESAAESLNYPSTLKPPYRPHNWTRHTKQKAIKVFDGDDLLSAYDHYCRWTDVLIAQEWIEGPESNLFSCNCYFDDQSEPVATFIARKLRQWPPITGQSCLGEECRNDLVLRESIRLFKAVGYRGLGYVEMKRDANTGRSFIVEPNVGRPTGRSALAEAAGVDLVYTMYCDAVGRPRPTNLKQTYQGMKWVHLLRDLQSAAYHWRRGDLNLRDWWNSVRGQKVYAVLSLRDPAPFFKAFKQAIPVLLSARERGKEDYQGQRSYRQPKAAGV